MAIENTYLLGKNITLGCGFDLQAKAPLDSRQTVPSTAGLQALIDGNAAYEGMIVYDEESKKTYQAQIVDDVLTFREFGINEAELKDLIASETTAAMEFKGAATALPENPAKGDMYKVTASFKVDEEDVKVGDSIVYDGEQWFIIPSGDDIEDTWRPVTGVDNDSTLTFVAGDKLEKTVAADGTITYKHVAIDAPEDMTAEDDEKTRTYITQLITDNHGHIIGFKTATENVEDTNTEYTFEGQSDEATSVYFQVTSSEEGASAEVIYLDAYSKNEADAELAKKVDKVEGYSLVSDDEIARLAKVDNYDDEEVRGLIDDLETYVGTIPTDEKYADVKNVISYVNKKAEETLAAAQGGSSETAASVKQQLDNYKSANDTRVKAVEDKADGLDAAIGSVIEQITQLDGSVALTYLSKEDAAKTYETIERVNELETTFINSVNAVVGTDTDDASKDTVKGAKKYADKAIEDANLSQYAKTADLAAETKARTEADADFETRIATLEGNFGDGEGTVEAQIAAAVKVEEDARKLAVKGVQDKVDALETASATHALKSEVEAVDAKFADYKTAEAQKAIDDAQDARIKAIEDDYLVEADIANFETKENVKKVADDLAAYVESNNAAVADRYTKAEADGKFALIADAYDDEEVRGLISDNTDAIAAEKERAEAAEAGLQTQINTIMNNPDTKDVIDSIAEFTQYVTDHGTIAEGMRTDINKNKEDIAALDKAIEDHEALAAETYETKSDANEKLTQAMAYTDGVNDRVTGILNADNPDLTSFKAIETEMQKNQNAATNYADGLNTAMDTRVKVLEGINHDAYVAADTALKTELQAEIDADVKALADTVYTKTEVEALLTWGSF